MGYSVPRNSTGYTTAPLIIRLVLLSPRLAMRMARLIIRRYCIPRLAMRMIVRRVSLVACKLPPALQGLPPFRLSTDRRRRASGGDVFRAPELD